MPDPKFLANNGLKSNIVQPQSVRSRHRYRGPRESQKLNLEAHQFYYDVSYLTDATAMITEKSSDQMDALYGVIGDTIIDDITEDYDLEVYWDQSGATPDSGDTLAALFESIPDIMARLDGIYGRLQQLDPVFEYDGYPGPTVYPSPTTYPDNG